MCLRMTNVEEIAAVYWEKQYNLTPEKNALVQISITSSVDGGLIHQEFQIVPNMDPRRNPSVSSVCVCLREGGREELFITQS